MVLKRSSSTSGGSSASNNFTITTGTSGNTRVDLSTVFSAGSYVVTSSLGDASYDIYLIGTDGTSAGYVNAAAASTTILATKSFNRVVLYGASNNDTLTFEFKYVFSANAASTSDHGGAAPRIISISDSALPNQNNTTVVTGQNFATDITATFTGTDNVARSAKSIVRSSSTSLIITRPDELPPEYSPYTITLSNPGLSNPTSSNAHKLNNSITSGAATVWSTSAILPSYRKNEAYSQSVLATDADGDSSITYSIVSGTLPSGVTFNTGNATFSGTPTTNSASPYTYTIRATDSGGNYVDRTFTVQQLAPDAPIIGTATDIGTGRAYNNGAVSVTFTAPAYTGASAITSYTVTASTGQTATGASSPITVSGIATGATPTFTVTATNSGGTSLSSSASSPVTVTTVPQAPTIGTASVTNSTTVSISFTAGATGGKSISSYITSSSPSISLSTSGTSSPVSVTGSYAGGQAYTFTIAAVNANGTSSSSSASNSITPLNLPTLSGGTLTSDATYYYRTFNSNGTLTVSGPAITVDAVIVGGGGGGGSNSTYSGMPPECDNNLSRNWQGGGAGGGGIVSQAVSISGSNAIVIGAGGTGSTTGAQSSAFSLAAGGGQEGPGYGNGGPSGTPQSRAGGSGSYSSSGNMTCWESGTRYVGGTTYNYPTNQSGTGGGGGGAGSVGSGTSGGSGTAHFGNTYSQGGNGGTTNSPRAANTGQGGHAYSGGQSNGAGGSGRVIVRYLKTAAIT